MVGGGSRNGATPAVVQLQQLQERQLSSRSAHVLHSVPQPASLQHHWHTACTRGASTAAAEAAVTACNTASPGRNTSKEAWQCNAAAAAAALRSRPVPKEQLGGGLSSELRSHVTPPSMERAMLTMLLPAPSSIPSRYSAPARQQARGAGVMLPRRIPACTWQQQRAAPAPWLPEPHLCAGRGSCSTGTTLRPAAASWRRRLWRHTRRCAAACPPGPAQGRSPAAGTHTDSGMIPVSLCWQAAVRSSGVILGASNGVQHTRRRCKACGALRQPKTQFDMNGSRQGSARGRPAACRHPA